MIQTAYVIPLLPFFTALIILFFFKEDEHSPAPYLGIAAMAWCLIQSICIFHGAAAGATPLPYEANWEWFTLAADAGGKAFSAAMPIGILIDGPASVMLVVVTLVSLLVQIYSLGYMHGDPRFKRYYAFLSFFTASMLGLVVSSNILVTFACWELVGVSSYLLIGFWFEKPGPAYASKKAFMTTKLGDCGLYLALLLIWAKFGTFKISMLSVSAGMPGILTPAAATAIGLGILCGAAGKSAQWPLFIWLPDAMEGPTPVSALIHAATMVAAGIYLVAKTYFIFVHSDVAMGAVAWVGLITALLTATMALVAYDIKRVLAFSTVSQLGFMMCALGCGGYTAGLFHLTTHAFFKALLFLGAGSVIHAVHTNDMRQMGGLNKKMPITGVTMAIATAAIAGVPPFAGYYSKDMILEKVWAYNHVMFGLLLFAALLTAFYMTRMMCLTFVGDDRDHEKFHHAHESPWVMAGPLVLLAFLSIVSGFALAHNGFIERLIDFKLPEGLVPESELPHYMPFAIIGLVASSIGLAIYLYGRDDFAIVDALKARFSILFSVLENRYGMDALFLGLVALSDKIARFAFWFDANVIDQFFVDSWALLTRLAAELSGIFDNLFVDRTVDGFGGLSMDAGVLLRSLVTHGQAQEYLMYIAVAVSLFTILILSR